MAKDAVVSEELAKKFATEKDTPYLRWVRGEGLDVIGAHYVRNLRTVELQPEPRRRLLEGRLLALDGRGSTTVWNDEGKRITFEWKAGAMFAIPLNCRHQHFNGSGPEEGRQRAAPRAPAHRD